MGGFQGAVSRRPFMNFLFSIDLFVDLTTRLFQVGRRGEAATVPRLREG